MEFMKAQKLFGNGAVLILSPVTLYMFIFQGSIQSGRHSLFISKW